MASPATIALQKQREIDKEKCRGVLVAVSGDVPLKRTAEGYEPDFRVADFLLRIRKRRERNFQRRHDAAMRKSRHLITPIRRNGRYEGDVSGALDHYRGAGYEDPKRRRGATHSTNPNRQNHVGKRLKPGRVGKMPRTSGPPKEIASGAGLR